MNNPIDSVSARIHGLSSSNPQKPSNIGSYKYHFVFNTMDDAWELAPIILPKDGNSIITTLDRSNMMLQYTPNLPYQREWVEWKYYEYASIEYGFHGKNYCLFGSGKMFSTTPDFVD